MAGAPGMPSVPGESLRARLDREGQLPLDQALHIAREIAAQLATAHVQGVVHRDLRPDNVLLEHGAADDRVLVTGFGVAKGGTPAYLSPEQAAGQPADTRSDIYALGCVLYEMLGGEPPHTGTTGAAIIAKRLHEPVPHLRALRPEVPAAIEAAVRRALAKSPADRFQNTVEFAGALSEADTVPVVHRPHASLALPIAAAGLLLAATVGGGALLRRDTATPVTAIETAGERRVVVTAFANRTGDPSLDALGDIVADYLSRGLAETRLVEVLDARAEQAGDSAALGEGLAAARALARTLGASSVVWGSYARRGDSLEFRAELTDAVTGKSIGAVPPAAGLTSQPTQGVEALRQRVMSALAARLDPRLVRFADVSASQPVSYEAYREFLAGDTMLVWGTPYHMVNDSGLARYRRAYALDTNFTLPIVEVARVSALWNCRLTDSIADALRPRRERLPQYERTQLDWVVARCHGQWEKALEIVREAISLAPRSDWLVYQYVWLARKTGRLREAIAWMERLDRGRQERDGGYWWNQVTPLHLLGEHQRELELAREARRLLPGQIPLLAHEAQALVGLGRLAEVEARVDEMVGAAPAAPDIVTLPERLIEVGRDLRAHGYRDEARGVFERGIRWIQARPAADQQNLRYELSLLLSDAERWDEAWPILQQLTSEDPGIDGLWGDLGVVAARRGDLTEVARIDRWLAARKGPYRNGRHTFERARLAAGLGDRDRAVQLYRQAMEEGLGYFAELSSLHSNPDFEQVRDYPPFQELIRPKD